MAGTATIMWINGLNPDTFAFISATGITDTTIQSALDKLVLSAKANGWWDLCNAIYPFVGGTATTHKYNLKDPRDLDAAFRLSFIGGWTHSATGGLPDGTTGYADTFLTPSVTLLLNSSHLSYYSRTNTAAATRTEIGSVDATSFNYIRIRAIGNVASGFINTNGNNTRTNTNSDCYMMLSRTDSSSSEYYKNGVSIGANNFSSISRPTIAMVLAALRNNVPSVSTFSDRECAFATIGSGINSTLALTMYNDIQTFQTTLGRQV